TTLRRLIEPEGGAPPLLPYGTYQHNKSEQTIRINHGGMIQYFGMDTPEKYGSLTLSDCGLDEVVEFTEPDYQQLSARCSLDVGTPRQLFWACNPGPPAHFIAKRFGLAGNHQPEQGCTSIVTRLDENFFLPAEYIERQRRTLTGLAYKRYFLGQWAGSDGLVYDRWDRGVHVCERPIDFDRIVVGVDYGYTNPYC